MKLTLLTLALTGALALPPLAAQTPTIPVGYVSVTIDAGTGVSRRIVPISLPLYGAAAANGQMTGQITALSASTLTNSNAGWSAGQLSQAASPYLIKLTSGVAIGRTFLISTTIENSDTTLTVSADDLVPGPLNSFGIAIGDTYEIIPCDTLGSFFGPAEAGGILGGTTAAAADQITLVTNGVSEAFYYNTTLNRWTKVAVGNPDASNIPLRPDSGLQYSRLAPTPLVLTVAGRVSATPRQAAVKASGTTLLAQGWPVGVSLINSNIHQIPGWVSAPTAAAADKVKTVINKGATIYWFDGTNWRRQALGSPISNNVILPAGVAVSLEKAGSSPGHQTLQQPLPYPLP